MRAAEREKVKIEVDYRMMKDNSQLMRVIIEAIVLNGLHKNEEFTSDLRRATNLIANYSESVTRVKSTKEHLKLVREEKAAASTDLKTKIEAANKIKEKLDAEKIRYSASCPLTIVQLHLLSHVLSQMKKTSQRILDTR